jgi:hypothetical protein
VGAKRAAPAPLGRIEDTDALDDFAKVFWDAALDVLMKEDEDNSNKRPDTAMGKRVRKRE